MTEYALVNPEGQVDRTASNVDPKVSTRAGWKWLPVELVDPTYDPDTEVKEGPTIEVQKAKVRRVWTVRAKTASELDGEKDGKLDAVDVLIFKVLLNHENRVRALEGKGSVTAAQFRSALKGML